MFCANCKGFIWLDSYEAEALGKNLRDVNPGPDKLQCMNCFDKWLYQRADVARIHFGQMEGSRSILSDSANKTE